MEKSGLKAISVLLTRRGASKRRIHWTLLIAVLSTLVVIALFAVFLMQASSQFP